MLKKVRIKNFLSCEDTEFDLEQITVLIGRNAAGKSNILKTIQRVIWFILGDERFIDTARTIVNGETTLHTEVEIDFLINTQRLKYILIASPFEIIEESLLFYDNNWKHITKRELTHGFYYYKNKKISIHNKEKVSIVKSIITFLPEEKITQVFNDFINYLFFVNYYTLEIEEEIDIIKESIYFKWLSNKNELDSSVIMRLLHAWDKNRELFDEIQEILGKNGLNLIDKILISSYIPESEEKLYFIKFSVNNTNLNYRLLSYGTQRVLSILLAILYDKSTILLIEHPENDIHIGLLRKVLAICFEYAEVYNKQLIITTHSPEVIDMFQAENVRLVRMTEHGTKVSKLDDKLLALVPEYLENEGTLSEFIESMDDE